MICPMRLLSFFPFLTICFIVSCNSRNNVSWNIYVDERVELTTIAFRVAGAEEWTNYDGLSYLNEVDEFFSPYKGHPLMSYIREIRETYSIGYGYVPSSAFLFSIDGDDFVFRDDIDYEKYTSYGWEYDSIQHYLELLESFYYDTDFKSFFDAQADRIKQTLEVAGKKLSSVDLKWFESFYGDGVQVVDCYIGMAMGRNNFSLPDTGEGFKNLTICLGCLGELSDTPILSDSAVEVSIHEINHYFSTPVIEEMIIPYCIDSFSVVYPRIAAQMEKIGYGDEYPDLALGEWLNQMFTDEYLIETKDWQAPFEINFDQEKGFIWMDNILKYMSAFRENRKKYPHIQDFVPQLIDYINSLPANTDAIERIFAASLPEVEYIYPVNNSTIPSDTKEIQVHFSVPMDENFGFKDIPGINRLQTRSSYWSKDRRTMIIPIKESLVSGQTYGVELLHEMYVAREGKRRLTENYVLMYTVKQ